MANFNQSLMFNGLGTISVKVPTTNTYSISGKISLPTLSAGEPQSSVVVTINQNGSPVYVGPAGARGFEKQIVCSANDILAMVFSSSATVDQSKNVIKSVIAVCEGEI